MNLALVAAIVSAVFLAVKMAIKYKDPNPKACIQDAVLVFASTMVGLYGYQKYAGKPVGPKVAAVFTEAPGF
jgi:hypothetical protein